MPTGETIRKINVGGTDHDVVGSAEALWGSIQGSISSQTDLMNKLNERVSYEDNGVLGAKNILRFPYDNMSASTNRGIIFTPQNDGSVTFSGTSNEGGSTSYKEIISKSLPLSAGSYKLTGGPSIYGGVRLFFFDPSNPSQKYQGESTGLIVDSSSVTIWNTRTGGSYEANNTYGYERIFTINSDAVLTVQIRSVSYNEYPSAVSGTIYPMLRLASDPDDTYVPYAKTNRELTTDKCENSVIANVENGATASRGYAVGEHFIRDGAFCTAKASIAQGAAFTLNTNYTAGKVGDGMLPSFIYPSAILKEPTLSEGYSNYSSRTCYYKVDGQVYVNISVTKDDSTSIPSNTELFRLPQGYRPARLVYGIGNNKARTGMATFTINDANGAVICTSGSDEGVFGNISFAAFK